VACRGERTCACRAVVVKSEGNIPPGRRSHRRKYNIKMDLKRYIKVKVKFTLEQATKAQRDSRGIPVLFL
jgi:Na+-transporting NADH:ubiquinone oxidoreductase subunit NqrF